MVKLWSVETCERNSASLLLWRRDCVEGQTKITASPYRCRSWRCRFCGWAVAREDFRRVEAAALKETRWLYAVLTIDPRMFASLNDAYLAVGKLWDKRLRRRLERQFDKIAYLQTWERHRSGWPHVNLLFRSDSLLEHVDELGVENRRVERAARRPRPTLFTKWRRDFRSAAMGSGFGRSVWLELVQDRRGMAHYLAKVAQEFTSSETKPGDQRPFEAPSHFRRIRASEGLLPPRRRVTWKPSTDLATGEESWTLVEKELDDESAYTGVLSPLPLATFSDRSPGWTDVADAWEYQSNARAARRRRKQNSCKA